MSSEQFSTALLRDLVVMVFSEVAAAGMLVCSQYLIILEFNNGYFKARWHRHTQSNETHSR